jgi:hypothetical protein
LRRLYLDLLLDILENITLVRVICSWCNWMAGTLLVCLRRIRYGAL